VALNKERLFRIRLSVSYYDNYVKSQAWEDEFFRVTDRLVFSAALALDEGPNLLLKKGRKRLLKRHHDWRRNPCLVRYRTDAKSADFFCERGKDDEPHRKSKPPSESEERGHPLGIEFYLKDESLTSKVYHCNADWMDNTAALLFRNDSSPGNGLPGLVIRRITSDGADSIVDIPKAGTPGPLPIPSRTGANPCGYPGFTWKMICLSCCRDALCAIEPSSPKQISRFASEAGLVEIDGAPIRRNPRKRRP
jgi:hypothetical protein